jgi:hypothetical protein
MKPYGEVPLFVAAIDVGLCIYRQCPAARYMDSQKIYEYLAAGKLVVSTDAINNGVESLYVRIGRSKHEFISLVREAIAESPDAITREEMNTLVAKHEWQMRVGQILDFLEGESQS